MAALRSREASCAPHVTLPPFQHVRSIHDSWLPLTVAVLHIRLVHQDQCRDSVASILQIPSMMKAKNQWMLIAMHCMGVSAGSGIVNESTATMTEVRKDTTLNQCKACRLHVAV